MQSLATLSGSDLVWQKRNWRKQAFDLYAGNDLIATVSWENWQQTKAIAQIGNKRWRFERQGFWRPRDVVSAVELGETVAVFERNRWGYGGTLRCLTQVWADTQLQLPQGAHVYLAKCDRRSDDFREWRDRDRSDSATLPCSIALEYSSQLEALSVP
jgi:hypothetical protein